MVKRERAASPLVGDVEKLERAVRTVGERKVGVAGVVDVGERYMGKTLSSAGSLMVFSVQPGFSGSGAWPSTHIYEIKTPSARNLNGMAWQTRLLNASNGSSFISY